MVTLGFVYECDCGGAHTIWEALGGGRCVVLFKKGVVQECTRWALATNREALGGGLCVLNRCCL